jgi:hypothetical protein
MATAATLVAHRFAAAMPAAKPIAITVYKTPTCGCCRAWVKHLESNGFAVTAHDLDDLAETKKSLGVPAALQSCHTGVTGRYVVEGHVPADVITKLVAEKPAVLGIAVPGMPSGSPGMEGGPKQKYDVIAFERGGKTRVYASR